MDILFAVPPFTDVEHPAIGVSELQAQLKHLGFSSKICYFNVGLAERIGLELYQWLALCGSQTTLGTNAPAVSMIGEWFFADLIFRGQIPEEDEYIARFLGPETGAQELIPLIREARRCRGEFIDRCVLEIERHSPRVVGFTTSFHQTCASLAVALRLKKTVNPPLVMFGGANCFGEMGLQMIRSFPWVDYVCTGEGDEVLPRFIASLLGDGEPGPVPGILKQGAREALSLPPPIREMDELPFPDYSDYFQRVRHSPLAGRLSPHLLIETSRGCWWGEKQHCTFCGLNGHTISYRSKSPKRVVQEFSYLCETYDLNRIDCVDNILDPRYLRTVFPGLTENGPKMHLFYATKSNLTFQELRLLRLAGTRSIQPGIESFSNQVLRLMRKGCTGLQNIQLLRWCEELGISVYWNVLYGFPGESPLEYKRMADLIPLLTHLQPPAFCEAARVDRFSPMFADPEGFGLFRRRPAPAYSYVYPLQRPDLERLAYYFDFDYRDGLQPLEYVDELIRQIQSWATLGRQSSARLELFHNGSVALINDTRPCAMKRTHVFSGIAAKVYSLCDVSQTIKSLEHRFRDVVSEHELCAVLSEFVSAKLMTESEGRYLSLAVMRTRDHCGADADNCGPEKNFRQASALVNVV